MNAPLTNKAPGNVAGVTLLELLIVLTMITVVAGFVLMTVVRARQVMVRENATRELMSYLEKLGLIRCADVLPLPPRWPRLLSSIPPSIQ